MPPWGHPSMLKAGNFYAPLANRTARIVRRVDEEDAEEDEDENGDELEVGDDAPSELRQDTDPAASASSSPDALQDQTAAERKKLVSQAILGVKTGRLTADSRPLEVKTQEEDEDDLELLTVSKQRGLSPASKNVSTSSSARLHNAVQQARDHFDEIFTEFQSSFESEYDKKFEPPPPAAYATENLAHEIKPEDELTWLGKETELTAPKSPVTVRRHYHNSESENAWQPVGTSSASVSEAASMYRPFSSSDAQRREPIRKPADNEVILRDEHLERTQASKRDHFVASDMESEYDRSFREPHRDVRAPAGLRISVQSGDAPWEWQDRNVGCETEYRTAFRSNLEGAGATPRAASEPLVNEKGSLSEERDIAFRSHLRGAGAEVVLGEDQEMLPGKSPRKKKPSEINEVFKGSIAVEKALSEYDYSFKNSFDAAKKMVEVEPAGIRSKFDNEPWFSSKEGGPLETEHLVAFRRRIPNPKEIESLLLKHQETGDDTMVSEYGRAYRGALAAATTSSEEANSELPRPSGLRFSTEYRDRFGHQGDTSFLDPGFIPSPRRKHFKLGGSFMSEYNRSFGHAGNPGPRKVNPPARKFVPGFITEYHGAFDGYDFSKEQQAVIEELKRMDVNTALRPAYAMRPETLESHKHNLVSSEAVRGKVLRSEQMYRFRDPEMVEENRKSQFMATAELKEGKLSPADVAQRKAALMEKKRVEFGLKGVESKKQQRTEEERQALEADRAKESLDWWSTTGKRLWASYNPVTKNSRYNPFGNIFHTPKTEYQSSFAKIMD